MTAVVNPGRGAWVQTPVPILSVHHSLDPDQDNLIYHFEIYNDALLTNLIAQTDSSSPEWVVTPSLNDHSWYYWRVQNEDEHGGVSEWMNPALLYVNDNNVDDPPDITLDEPENNMYLNTGSVSIKWEDRDPDSNAQISLYYDTDSAGEDGVLIADSIYEDLDGNDDTFVWDIEGIPDGTYYIYAVIEDETSSSASYSTAAITIDRVPPVVDTAPDEGVYNSVIFVSVSANEPSDIYCTLDNTEPAVDSLVYTDSLEITETTILKCVAVDRAGNISEILTKTFVIDTDNDGMSDKWERDHFGDLSRDGTLDYDADGLSDSDEYLHKTDPKDKDTDNDGFSDGDEVAAGSDPLDKDSTPSIISFSITEIKQDWDNAGNITITFESESGKEYDIFYKNAFTDSFTLAEKVTGSAESTSWTDDGSYTGSHPIEENERYYKVSHNGSDSDNTVGMFTIMVHEGMNLISLPLIPLSTALEDVLGSQITGSDNEAGADRFWSWTGTGYEFAWLVGGVGEPYDGQWYTGNEPTMLTFEPDKGAWIQIRPGHGTHDIYIVGEVSTEGRAVSINEGMNLIGICYPVSVPLANTNLWESGMTGADNEASSDRIWMWKGTNYDFIWLVDGVGASYDGQWYKGNEPFDGKFEPGRGYWIQVREGHAEFVWEYVKPY